MSLNIEDGENSNVPEIPKTISLGTWDIVAIVGYFVVILGVGMLVSRRPKRTLKFVKSKQIFNKFEYQESIFSFTNYICFSQCYEETEIL